MPRHRAQRTADHPARRARLTPAVPAPRSGLDATGLHRAELHGTGLHGTALNGSGLAGSGPDDTDTAPLAVLPGTLPPGFDSEVSGLASLAVTGAGELHGGAADGAVTDNGTAVLSSPGDRPPSHSRRRIQRAASAAASQPPGRQRGLARGVLMTPWFAAASGFVIAASMWIYSSHPQLTFPITTGPVQCGTDGCSPQHVDRQGAGALAINSGQPLPPQHKPATAAKQATRDRARTAASGLSFRYVERPAADGNFYLIVIVTGKRPIKDWHLAFVLAGDQIQSVFGADWQGKGSDRVAASPLTGGQGLQDGGSGNDGGSPSQGGYDYGRGGAFDQHGVFFRVIASGTPAPPTQCRFNGASCTFHELSTVSQGGR